MDQIEAVAPGNHNLEGQSSSFGSTYFDALDTPSPQHEPPQVRFNPPIEFSEHDRVHKNSTFVCGAKPRWGWDYTLCFKIPETIKQTITPKMKNRQGLRNRLYKGNEGAEPNAVTSLEPPEEANNDEDDKDPINSKTVAKSKELTEKRTEILARLKSAGFVFSQLLIPSEGMILVRLSLPEKKMKEKAAKLGMELRLKSEYGGGYLKFRPDRENIFVNDDEGMRRGSYFSPADRAIIIINVLQSKEDWGCDLNIERLLYDQTVIQAFAIHSTLERKQLIADTVWKRLWDPFYVPPFSAMKDYLGARVTFYFVFVSFYARRLLLIALLSIPIYVLYRLLKNFTAIAILRWVFSIGLVLWTTVFLETWKRRNANVNLEWGLDDYKDDTADDTRAQFMGDMRFGFYSQGGFVSLSDLVEDGTNVVRDMKSMEEGKGAVKRNPNVSTIPKNPYQDLREARMARLQSFGVTVLFVLMVGSLTFVLLWFRNEIVQYFDDSTGATTFANAVPGVLNGVLITVFDSIWRTVSLKLTRRENHRTNQEFENSLVYKRFSFQFVSNYISLLYIAFIRPFLNNTCRSGYFSDGPDCMVELEIQLMSLLITKATVGQVTEIGVPFVTSRIRQWQSRSKSKAMAATPAAEKNDVMGALNTSSGHTKYIAESKLATYDSTIEDYGELVLQFGYVALFGLAFPPAAVVALLNNLIEGRTDAYKVLVLSQRVTADDAADIGAWYPILEFLNVLSVVSNAGLVIFTAEAADTVFKLDELAAGDVWRKLLYRVVAFFIMEHILLSVKAGAAFLIPDVPSKTTRKGARQRYDAARFFDEGWRDAFRGNSLLQVDDQQIQLCEKYALLFDVASDNEK